MLRTNEGLRVRVDPRTSRYLWCGTAALGAALNTTAAVGHDIIRLTSLRKYIKGVTYKDMAHAVASRGIKTKTVKFPRKAKDCLTLNKWFKTREVNCTYLVCITGHWIAVRGNHFADSMNRYGRLVDDCPYLKSKVRFTIQLLEDQS